MVENEGDVPVEWVRDLTAGLKVSDQKISTASLADGWDMVRHRGALIRNAMQEFFTSVIEQTPPRGAIGVHALGGTGRQEICPGSDVDIGIVVENVEENEHFLRRVSQRLRQVSPLVPGLRTAVKANAFHDLRDEKHFDLKSLVSLLDADLLVGDLSFDQRIRRVCQERAAELGLDFIFAVNQDFRRFDKLYPQEPGDVGGFHVKDGKGGLRNFQMTMWLYSFERWIPSIQVYEQVRSTRRFDSEGAPTPPILDAVGVLFSARCWIEQRRAVQREEGNESSRSDLTIDVADMEAYLERFGAEGLTQLNSARQTVDSYRHETMDRLLEHGVVVPDTDGLVVWGTNGLRLGADAYFSDATTMFYCIYGAQQQFKLGIDKSIKRAARQNIGRSLRPDEAFIKMMATEEPIYPALKDWFDYDVLGMMLPGFDVLANTLYEMSNRAATLTLAARAIQRVESLEHLAVLNPDEIGQCEAYFVKQYHDIGDSARCALRITLLTEEVPEALYAEAHNYAEAVQRYVGERLCKVPGLSGPMLRTVEFLSLMKRELLKDSETSEDEQVLQRWHQRLDALELRDPADTIRALALFAYAAFDFQGMLRARLDSEQWRNIQNLTQNLLYDKLEVTGQSFEGHYFDELGRRIGNLLPRKLLASPHVDNTLKPTYEGQEILDPQRAHRLIISLRDVVRSDRPKVELRRGQQYDRLILFAWEFPGLFWRVAEVLHDLGCSIRTTDLYGIPDPAGEATDGETLIPGERRLVCDVLTFDRQQDTDETWYKELTRRILQRLECPDEPIANETRQIIEPMMEDLCPRVTDLGGGMIKFSCHTPTSISGTRYAMGRILSESAGASIESIVPDGTRDWDIPRTNFYVRVQSDLDSFAQELRKVIGDVAIHSD